MTACSRPEDRQDGVTRFFIDLIINFNSNLLYKKVV